MTAAVPLVERLAEALAGHESVGSGCSCGGDCGWTYGEWLAHLARALLPVVEQAVAEARGVERSRIAQEIEALPTTRTKAWDKGWDSISLADALNAIHPDAPATEDGA